MKNIKTYKKYKIFFLSDHKIMVKVNKHRLKELSKNKGIIDYRNKPKKKVLKNITKYFKKQKKDLRCLFKKITKKDYYKPIETKSTFKGNYIKYESRGDNDDNLSLEEYLNTIRLNLKDMIDNHKVHSEWKIELIMHIIFVSSLNTNENHIRHTKRNNIEITNCTETDEAINELFNSFLRKYQEGLETKMKGSGYILERVDLLEYHLHKIILNRGSSYIDSHEWVRNNCCIMQYINMQ